MVKWRRDEPIPKVVAQATMMTILIAHGWALDRGRKHNVKMTKQGCRPIPLAQNAGKDYPVGTRNGILKQAEIVQDGKSEAPRSSKAMHNGEGREPAMTERKFTIEVSQKDAMFWGEVVELPGVFASGESWDELGEAVAEAIEMALDDDPHEAYTFSKSPPMPSFNATKAELSFA